MKIGIHLPQVEYQPTWEQQRKIAETIESEGFDSIWLADHLLYKTPGGYEGPWETWTQLAAVAAVTKRVEIGTLVAALGFHKPAVLAKMAATVDEISGGRFIFGMGAGWNRFEFDSFDIPFDHRFLRFSESFQIIRRLLKGETVNFAGDYNTVRQAVLKPPPRGEGPRLLIGSNGEKMLDLTIPHVDMWNTWCSAFENEPSKVTEALSIPIEACRRVGRDPSTLEKSVVVIIEVGDADKKVSDDKPISGTPAEIASAFHELQDAGVDHVQVALTPITPDAVCRLAEALHIFRG